MDIMFSSLEELYKRLTPALKTKAREMVRENYDYIKEQDIWNYLKETKWCNARDLSLSEMVDHVLNSKNEDIDNYVKGKIKRRERRVYFDEGNDLL